MVVDFGRTDLLLLERSTIPLVLHHTRGGYPGRREWNPSTAGMGCVFSKQAEAGGKYRVQGSVPTSPSKPGNANLDQKDFVFENRTGETLVKPPGSIDGQQFQLDGCEDCEIYLLDTCDSVMIDDCKRCKIVVGPTTGSVFLRDCVSCVVVCACRQFRTRDCVDIDTRLLVATRPIIETSTNMKFGCFDFHWKGLEGQLRESGMSAFGNFWSHVFNFNPDTQPDWSLVPAESTSIQLLSPLPNVPSLAGIQTQLGAVSPKFGQPPFCVKTWGERKLENESANASEGCLVLCPCSDEKMARELLTMTAGKALLVRTNSCALSEPWLVDHLARQLFIRRGDAFDQSHDADTFDVAERTKMVKALARGKCLGLEFGGAGCVDAVRAVADAAGFPTLTDPQRYAEWRYKGVEG